MAKEFLRSVNENGRISLANPGEGARDAHPSYGPISFIFMQISGKLWPNNRLSTPILGNSGSDTGYKNTRSTIERNLVNLLVVNFKRNSKFPFLNDSNILQMLQC